MKKAIIELLYNDSNLKGILEQENFHTFSLDYYSKSHIDPLTGRSARDAIETALRVCHHFIDTFSSEFHNILLYGDTGVGKTFLTHCIACLLYTSRLSQPLTFIKLPFSIYHLLLFVFFICHIFFL